MRTVWVVVVGAVVQLAAARAQAREPPLSLGDDGNGEMTTTLDGVRVEFRFALPRVERATAMPLRIDTTVTEGMAPGDVPARIDVQLCADWRCGLHRTVTVPVPGHVELITTHWPGTFTARIRAVGESSCCGAQPAGVGVVATTRRGWPQRLSRPGDSAAGLVTTAPVTTLDVVAHPEMLDGVGALDIADIADIAENPGRHGDDPTRGLAPAVLRLLGRGGVVSLPRSLVGGLGLGVDPTAGDLVIGGGDATFDLDGRDVPLRVAAQTRRLAVGPGTVVLRPDGVDADEALAGIFLVAPGIFQLNHEVSQAPESAAAVLLTGGPPAGAAFGIVLLGLAAVVLVVRRGRRAAWASTVALSLAAGGAATVAVLALTVVTVPAERHVRVLTWSGPDASWEQGVDAVRARFGGAVTAQAPVPALSVSALGDDVLSSEWSFLDGDSRAVRARIGPGSALAVAWSRPAPQRRAVEWTGQGSIANHLAVPLRAVRLSDRNLRHGPVAAGGAVLAGEFREASVGDAMPWDGLAPGEERLLQELLNGCLRRDTPHDRCASAIARLDDGTLLGVEVAR